MSNLRVTSLRGRTVGVSPTLPDGAVVTGVATATTFDGNVTGNISGGTVAGSTGTFTGDVDIADKIVHTGDTNTSLRFPAADTFTVETGGSEAARFDSSQRLLLGNTSSETSFRTPKVQIKGTDNNTGILIHNTNSDTDGSSIIFAHSRGSGTVNSGDLLGDLVWCGNDGTDIVTRAAYIRVTVDGAPSGNDMPGRIQFYTNDGSANPTERLRITSDGKFGFKTTTPNYTVDINGELGITEGQPVTWHDGSGNAAAQIYGDSSSNLIFRTGVAAMGERMRLLPAGGLTFNGDTATANALDDYEEGTWTPSIGGNATYNTQSGNYIKVGTMVLAHFRLSINAKGTGSTIGAISGLPFSSAKASQNTSNLTWASLGTNIIYGVYYVGSGSQTLNFSYASSAAGSLTNNPDIFANGASITGTIMYISS